ncbi:glutamate decarboxylase [Ferrimonas balearica]|uniref:glutamate decarboxylase n=1 Tax=Ferrimonas balearica TaxID=44012 RepID=UPI001C99F486|nr:glutamate decarboxylase [Ferrimonas balearica]MBY5921522.1 glutamate decarboxylase [Ferrimonas balearica]MBY5995793.1 glutamate decarboxylase [Ferrimonas balearica]
MSLISRDDIRHKLNDTTFAARDTAKPLPKYKFPPEEQSPRDILQLVEDELYLDGNPRQNLATFCQTWEEDEVHRILDQAIDRNMIDKSEYPQTAELEIRCAHMLADLWNAPDLANSLGTSTVGSSEACMLGGMAAKWRWRARRKAQGKPTDKPNLVCGPVQICWVKFCRYWDIEMRQIPMKPGNFGMDVERMLEAVDENTICVVPTFGVTYTGHYEQVKPLSDALDLLQQQTGLDIDLHVDAASGGFLAPFCTPDIVWDFRLPRVKSISTSGHKYGLAPLGVGWIVWRDKAELPEDLIFSVPYLGGQVGTFAINFSRPAGQVVAQYYLFNRLGFDGYKRVQDACYQVAQYLANELNRFGLFEFINTGDPKQGIPAVCFRVREGETLPFSLYDLSAKLLERGWQVPAFQLSGEASDIAVMRVMVRQGVDMDLASLLMDDIRRAIEHFQKRPVQVPLTQSERGSFTHG